MINKAILMGRLTRDPELRHTGSGTPVCSFSIAIDNGYGENRQTDFINCVAWNKTAEFVEKYFTKGRMVVVSGALQIRNYTDKDGNKRRNAEVIANNVYFADSKPNADHSASYGAPSAPVEDYAVIEDTNERLPF